MLDCNFESEATRDRSQGHQGGDHISATRRLRMGHRMGRRGAGRIVTQVGVAIGGLALGVGVIALRSHHIVAYKPGTPSIAAFPFDTSTPSVAPTTPVTVAPLATEPADAAGAIGAFLAPLADGRPEMAYPLLDRASRARYPSPTAWARLGARFGVMPPTDRRTARPRTGPLLACGTWTVRGSRDTVGQEGGGRRTEDGSSICATSE